jgi:hypothetical protein
VSGWHRTHPDLAGTAADPWMSIPAHRQAHDELVRTGVIDPPEQEAQAERDELEAIRRVTRERPE